MRLVATVDFPMVRLVGLGLSRIRGEVGVVNDFLCICAVVGDQHCTDGCSNYVRISSRSDFSLEGRDETMPNR